MKLKGKEFHGLQRSEGSLLNKGKQMELRQEILQKVQAYYNESFEESSEFIPGMTPVPYAGRVFDSNEMTNLVDSALDFWLTFGRYSKEFEKRFSEFLGVKYCFLVNSGSSANLLAFMALTSDQLGDRKINRGDEVITVAAGFPTTVAPIIQYGAVPVFVDVDLKTANIDVTQLEEAWSERTKAVMLAHTLGNPFNLDAVKSFCEQHGLWLIEDNCDALGSTYGGHYTGTFGDIGTSSFYPPHHMTMGEGGAVYTNNVKLSRVILSLRDWGRDCFCQSGRDNTCGHRFDRKYGELPEGYDHKYVYSHFGYNLKVTDMQAAIGCAQLDKLPYFIAARKRNWQYYRHNLTKFEDVFILPEATEFSDPSWFGFMLTLRPGAFFSRKHIVEYLESHGVQTRMLFAGNLIRQPCFNEIRQLDQGYRVVNELTNTDLIMQNSFWLGVYPGMTEVKLNYVIYLIERYIEK